MGTLGKIGKGASVLTLGALGISAVSKIADDRHVDELWRGLEAVPSPGMTFSEEMVADLPSPARRYFLHAIRPGTPLASRVYMTQSGNLTPAANAPSLSFTARQLLVPYHGFIWKARAQYGPVVLTTTDHYAEGEGRMRILLYGLIPVVNAGGPDLSRSAIGRLAGESVWLPSSLLPQSGAKVEPVDDDHFRATVTIDGEVTSIVMAVDPDGRLIGEEFQRYGNQTEDGHYQYIPFGGPNDEEGTFCGYTIPTLVRAGWWYGTDRYHETFRIRVESARFE